MLLLLLVPPQPPRRRPTLLLLLLGEMKNVHEALRAQNLPKVHEKQVRVEHPVPGKRKPRAGVARQGYLLSRPRARRSLGGAGITDTAVDTAVAASVKRRDESVGLIVTVYRQVGARRAGSKGGALTVSRVPSAPLPAVSASCAVWATGGGGGGIIVGVFSRLGVRGAAHEF